MDVISINYEINPYVDVQKIVQKFRRYKLACYIQKNVAWGNKICYEDEVVFFLVSASLAQDERLSSLSRDSGGSSLIAPSLIQAGHFFTSFTFLFICLSSHPDFATITSFT
jgi:hypothetical protein